MGSGFIVYVIGSLTLQKMSVQASSRFIASTFHRNDRFLGFFQERSLQLQSHGGM